ncbi:GNAT family N-acetyltransferase [Spiractinospora alimapuensis]|uniref:GNAT family N-acetyltransferase n=1 Tax=Spiractinospora alimapuensis TaxID=2820884 RepID=UPI001F37830C|nr:GNAT family N-acetyltransferase [Spiractinospora alimapuensis]QVQ52102.1 GNAT family N-acetyltransferase [Spiractinospora alimapuensis]
MDVIDVNGDEFTVRRATAEDVTSLVALLRDDVLGAGRENADSSAYERAFQAIDQDPNQFLAVVRDAYGALAGTMQLTLIPGLSRGGATRLQIEAVRLASTARGTGLGSRLFDWAHDFGRRNGATLAQLTTDKTRVDARRFYDRLGYTATHEGLKLAL